MTHKRIRYKVGKPKRKHYTVSKRNENADRKKYDVLKKLKGKSQRSLKRTSAIKLGKKYIKNLSESSAATSGKQENETSAAAEQIVTAYSSAAVRTITGVAKTPKYVYKGIQGTKFATERAKDSISNAIYSKNEAKHYADNFKKSTANLNYRFKHKEDFKNAPLTQRIRVKDSRQIKTFKHSFKTNSSTEYTPVRNTVKRIKLKSSLPNTTNTPHKAYRSPTAKNIVYSNHLARLQEKKSYQVKTYRINTTQNIKESITDTLKTGGKAVTSAFKSVIESAKAVIYITAIIALIFLGCSAAVGFLSSALGIFFPDENSSTISIREAVQQVNAEYIQRMNQLVEEYDNSSIDIIQYTGQRTQWKYVLAIYAAKYSDDGNVMTVDEKAAEKLSEIFFDMHDFSISYSQQDSEFGSPLNVLTIITESKSMSDMMKKYKFSNDQKDQIKELLTNDTDELWTALLYGIEGKNGGYALAEIAREQIGTIGGQTYTTWYGYDVNNAPKEWSGCLVSWCADQIGYITQGLFPQFSNSATGMEWFKNQGMWTQSDVTPNVGDIIFFDYHDRGYPEKCGIITEISDGKIKYITQFDGIIKESAIVLSDPFGYIAGYGILAQKSGLKGDTLEMQCYNYLRADGYSELAACVVLANFQGECSCDPGIIQIDYGDAAGLMMWTGANKNHFFSWCNNNAMDWRNLETQLYFYSYWLDAVNSGEWGRVSTGRHPDFHILHSTQEFKNLSASTYDGDIARALYEGTAMFVDDMERPADTWGAETRRYTYAVQFYNYIVEGGLDGTTQAAWRPEYGSDIGVFHLN